MRSVLYGISQRKFGQTAEHVAESFGRSGSTTGRVFKEETEKALKHFMTRRFDDLEFVAFLINGKTLREEQILLAAGLTTKGEKIILGFVEAKTESHSCVVALLQDLQERGFQVATTLLVLLDGGKGLRKGVLEVFGEQALIQRCQWHKRENVTSKIQDPEFAAETRKKMEAAYAADTYDQAKGQLQTLMQVLDDRCPKAAASLREGLEETLTLHKPGVPKLLRDRLRTTNMIVSINGALAHTTRKVTRWCNSNQRQRWIAAACLKIEEHSLNSIPQDWQWEGLLRALKRHGQIKKHYPASLKSFRKFH